MLDEDHISSATKSKITSINTREGGILTRFALSINPMKLSTLEHPIHKTIQRFRLKGTKRNNASESNDARVQVRVHEESLSIVRHS